MNNKKGFIFLETIITVVVLMTTLVFMYSSYSNVVIAERIRLYHDDISYIYKTKHIRDVVAMSIDEEKFNEAVDAKINGTDINSAYLYMFGVESRIFNDNTFLSAVYDLYHIYRLVYIKISDIPKIKECLNKDLTDNKCKGTKTLVEAYGYSYFKDYLLTLDVPTDSANSMQGHDAILVSLIYENKHGDVQTDANTNIITIGKGKYSECIRDKVLSYPSYSGLPLEDAMERYTEDQNVSFNMHCENAYYLSWVYF